MSLIFNGPIPGQSLTTEPKAMPFERPPEIVDPIEALDMHIDNLSNPDSMEDALFFLEMGLDLVSLVEGILRSAVMEGIHSIDISLIIGPVIHEHIKAAAIRADIEFNEGFEDPERDKAMSYERDTMRAKKMLRKLREQEGEETEATPVMSMTMLSMAPEEETIEEEPMEVEEEQPAAPQGLMARV